MDDFSLADAIEDDVPGKASRMGNTNPSAPANNAPPATNPGWPGFGPGTAPGGPNFPPPSGPSHPSAPSGPGAPGPYPGAPANIGHFSTGPGAPGQYPGPPSVPGGFPPGSGVPAQYPSGPGGPGHFPAPPGQFPAGGSVPGQFPGGATLPYPSGVPGQFPQGPCGPQGPYPNLPFPGGQPAGAYGPGAPGTFPPAIGSGSFPGFPSGAYPPIPPGTWGPPAAGSFPAQPNHPGSFGPGSMGPYPNPSFGGQAAPGGMLVVPYHLPLHSGILPGLVITIEGEPTSGADRFHVDFVKGPDTVFHLNPRFHEQSIVRNANLGGYWGPEERGGGFPFVPGRRFELKILVEEDVFKVAVDGNHLLEYEHRVGGLEEVTLLRVEGDIVLYSVSPRMI